MPLSRDGKTYYEPIMKPWCQDSTAKSEPVDVGHIMAGAWTTVRVGARPLWQGHDVWPWKALVLIHQELQGVTVQAEFSPEELDALISLLQIARRNVTPPPEREAAKPAKLAKPNP